jgi:hypothetical protein
MKLVKIFCTVALLVMSAAAVNAGTINNDPKLTIQKPGGTVTPAFQSFGPHSQVTDVVDVVYNGSQPLTSLIVGIVDPKAGEVFTGESNIFNIAETIFVPPSLDFTGASSPAGSPCTIQGGLPDIGCPGEITKGEIIAIGLTFPSGTTQTVTIPNSFSCVGGGATCSSNGLIVDANQVSPTPEPSTMLLFFSLGPAIGFAKKRWNARQSA